MLCKYEKNILHATINWLSLIIFYNLKYTKNMELQGRVINALEPRSGTSARGEWTSQDFVIETINDSYPRKMVFSVFGAERLQRFAIQVGQIVNVSFDIDAREYNGRWFNSIRAYDVRPVQATPPTPVAPIEGTNITQAAPNENLTQPFPPAKAMDDDEELPF